eukprot:TRINITY_DN26212_c0_g1_i1.p1 TRINITY_DN26212_c0_g1~~TRINITY_DN26212_c0_g1_i1.p1  ORF type:complete len:307 (+),score=41.54 TRINITY_DN26212_c0_g1_i1:83-1003(+)
MKPLEALRWAAPSVLTLGALVCGLTAVRLAAEEDFVAAVSCILGAAVLDGLDGHVARYLGAATTLGFELDSICDVANFGVVPALVVYFWAKALPIESRCATKPEECWFWNQLLWLACVSYSCCCAFRLARFNAAGHAEMMDKSHLSERPVESQQQQRPIWECLRHNVMQRKLYFQGVPAPVGATYALMPMLLQLSGLPAAIGSVGEVGAWAIGRRGAAATLFVTGALMVSAIPTFSSKMLKTDKNDSHLRSRSLARRLVKFAGGALSIFFVCRYPAEVVLATTGSHLLSIPVGVVVYYSLPNDKSS